MSSQLNFVRISASQNTFLFVNATTNSPKDISDRMGFKSVEDFVQHWSMGKNGLSADGVVFVGLSEKSGIDFLWHFYNCDGSIAEMCGNASRALSTFVSHYLGFSKNIMVFETLAGSVTAERLESDNLIKITMPRWKIVVRDIAGADYEGVLLLNTGVPHCVVEVENINNVEQNLKIAKALRFVPEAGPRGANVSFFQRSNSHQIKAVTFERGVENFTRSCGTGVVASAIAYLIKNHVGANAQNQALQSVDVDVPGGHLKTLIHLDQNLAYLIGDARIDFEVQVNI